MGINTVAPSVNEQHNLPLQQLQDLIDEAQASDTERRDRGRIIVCCTMRLIPIDHRGNALHDGSIDIVGKDISLTTIAFSHQAPLPSKRAVISFDHPKIGRFVVEQVIDWTRQTPLGLYESGGRVIKKAAKHILCVK